MMSTSQSHPLAQTKRSAVSLGDRETLAPRGEASEPPPSEVMEVSSQDPSLMAMDLSKSYKSLSRSHTEAMNLAKKPEWYHRGPQSCGTDVASMYRSRDSTSFNSLSLQAAAPIYCRGIEQGSETAGNYINSTLAPGVELYPDGVHGNLWHPHFYRPDQSGCLAPESSGGEESDSSSDVIFLVSSAKEPILCTPFIQDSVRHIVEPLSPAVSLIEEGRGCCHLPQPMSSPSPDSSYTEDSSDSSVDIPVHHTRPIVLLSDLSDIYGNHADSTIDISSDDSDVVQVSATNDKKSVRLKRSLSCKTTTVTQSPSQSEEEKAPSKDVRRSSRIRKSVPATLPQSSGSVSRYSLRRRAKNNSVGIYNESFDSDVMVECTVRSSSPEADKSESQPNAAHQVSSNSDVSDVEARTQRKSPQRELQPCRKASNPKCIKAKEALNICKTKKLKKNLPLQKPSVASQQRQKSSPCRSILKNVRTVTKRKRRRQTGTGFSALFSPREPDIKLKYAKVKEEKKGKTLDRFCPFVYMNHKTCTIVNFPEEEEIVRSSRRGQQCSATRYLPGFIPSTSCFKLGRLGLESRCQAALLCSLCGQTANAMGLGDLHGPYYPTGPPVNGQNCRTQQKKEEEDLNGLANSHSVYSSDSGCNGQVHPCPPASRPSHNNDCNSAATAHPHLDECWIHEDCVIWSAGIFLVNGKLYGLAEAARLAQETVCSTCQKTGAIIGCFQKGCPRNFHYRCAIQSGCILNEENFSMRCTEHKNKVPLNITRVHTR